MSEVFDEDMEIVNDEDVITSDDAIDDVIVLQENELKVGLVFKSEESAVKSIMLWSEKTFSRLSKSKARHQKPKVKPSGERVKGRRCFQCGRIKSLLKNFLKPEQIQIVRCQKYCGQD